MLSVPFYDFPSSPLLIIGALGIIVAIAVFLLAYPIFDMSRVIIGRIKRNSSPFLPDNSHFHHILLRKGFSNTRTILIIFTLTILLASLSLLFR